MDHVSFLDICFEEAELARQDGAMPVGAVIVAPEGGVLSRGRNRALTDGDQTAHAEVDAIRNAGRTIMTDVPEGGWVLYSSAEPCLMCLGAIILTPISTIVWASDSVTGSAYRMLLPRNQTVAGQDRTKTPLEVERIRALTVVIEPSDAHRSRSRDLLREFFTAHGNVARAELY
jgi:tRNA(Arg) A34 adenosine deaminase TadA